MNRTQSIVAKALFLAMPLGVVVVAATPGDAEAQYIAPPAPPDDYIATTPPEYFEGRPVYYYRNSWYYRDQRGAWNYYRSEPPYLRDRRAHWPANDRRYRYHR